MAEKAPADRRLVVSNRLSFVALLVEGLACDEMSKPLLTTGVN